jgi:uncharacterized protein (TIGR03435 family)
VEAADGSLYRLVDGKAQTVSVGERIDAGGILRTDEGAGAVLALPDGSRIEMHAKSELSVERADDGVRVRLNDGSVLVTPAKQRTGNLYVQNRETTVPVTGALFQSTVAPTATAPQTPDPAPAFEVVSIRPSNAVPVAGGGRGTAVAGVCGRSPKINPGRFVATDTTLYELITRAYRIGSCESVNDFNLLSGGPAWIKSDRFDIQATIPEGSFNGTPQLADPKLRKMLQVLLSDRFKLRVRPEMKEMSVYVLTPGKDGTKLTPSQAGDSTGFRSWLPLPDQNGQTSRHIEATRFTVAGFARLLTELGRPVLDRTGITGTFNFVLEFAPLRDTFEFTPGTTTVIAGSSAPPLPTAVEVQLGLKLEATRAPVEVWVIDHAEKPSEN